MFSFDLSRIIALIMAFIALVTSIAGIVNTEEVPQVIADITEKAPDDDLRVMSFNIRCTNVGTRQWQDRIGVVTQTILRAQPDSVGLQEATPEWMTTLNSMLTGYAYVGVGRDNGIDLGEYSAIFYLKDKYNVIDSGTFWLSETPDEPSLGWDAACNRVCTWIILENKESGQRYMHMNAHFDHIGVEARRHSAEMVAEFAAQHNDVPVVFTADMNVREGSDSYLVLQNSGVLKDGKFLAEDTMDYLTFHDTKPSQHIGQILDYVFVNSLFDPEVYRVVTAGIDGEYYVSDHFPIYADLNFTAQ